jgi:hypothetical protein
MVDLAAKGARPFPWFSLKPPTNPSLLMNNQEEGSFLTGRFLLDFPPSGFFDEE